QHLTVPSVMSAHPNSSPAEIWLTLVRALAPRVDESLNVPSPCWPNWFRPAHWTVPSGRLTQVYSPPADTPLGVTAPFAVNCCACPTETVGLAGVIVMAEAGLGGPSRQSPRANSPAARSFRTSTRDRCMRMYLSFRNFTWVSPHRPV